MQPLSVLRHTTRFGISLAVFFTMLLAGCGGGGGGNTSTVTAPSAPTGIAAIAGDGKVIIRWNSVAGASSYNLYMASVSGVKSNNYGTLANGMVHQNVSSAYIHAGLTNGATYYFVLTAVNSAGESAESSEVSMAPSIGPGDTGNYFPFNQGNTWRFQGSISKDGGNAVDYFNTTKISGTKEVAGLTTIISEDSNFENSGKPVADYILKDSWGITLWGNNDTTDAITPKLIPYQAIVFPLELNSTIEVVNRTAVDYGEDIDGDGITETIDISVNRTIAAFEDVTVQVGTFQNSTKILEQTIFTITLSSDKSKVNGTTTTTMWYAPGVGPIKYISASQAEHAGITSTTNVTETLVGYLVNGSGKGILSEVTIAAGVTTTDSRAAIGYDGTNYLVVTCRDTGSPTGVVGVIVSVQGEALNSFSIAQQTCGSTMPAVSFDGTNYLVVFVKDALIKGIRVSPSGSVLDGPDGFAISSGTQFVITNYSPAVAFDGTNYLVSWVKYDSTQSGQCSSLLCDTLNFIYGSLVTKNGQALGEFQIYKGTGYHRLPSIGFDGTNFLVVWENEYGGPGTSIYSSLFAIYTSVTGARITPAGVVIDTSGMEILSSGPFDRSPQTGGAQLVFDGSNYFVAWLNHQPSSMIPAPGKLIGMRIKPDGALLDSGGILVAQGSSISSHTIAFDGNNYFIAYVLGSYPQYPPAGIFAKRVSVAGNLIDGPTGSDGMFVSGPSSMNSRTFYPGIYYNGNNSLLTWVHTSETSPGYQDLSGALIYPF